MMLHQCSAVAQPSASPLHLHGVVAASQLPSYTHTRMATHLYTQMHGHTNVYTDEGNKEPQCLATLGLIECRLDHAAALVAGSLISRLNKRVR